MKKNFWILNHYASTDYQDRGGRHYFISKYLKTFGYAPVVFCAQTMHNTSEVADLQEQLSRQIEAPTGVPFVFVKACTYTGNGKQRVLNMIDFYRNVKRAAKEYAKQQGNPDVIYASSVHPLTLVAGIQLAKYFGVKCICEVRDLWPESIVVYSDRFTRKNPLIRLLYAGEKWIYKKADALVFTAEGSYDYIVEQGWEQSIPREKVYYINNGVDLEQFDYNRGHYTADDPDLDDPNTFKVVYTGSVRRVNNLGLLLDTAKKITDPRIRFFIWGDGDEKSALEQRVKDEAIQNVVFKGRVEKKYVPSIVSRADLNIAHNTPAELFRFGISFNKLFDYLAAGKPVLSDFPCPYNPSVQCGAGVSVNEPTTENIAGEIERLACLPQEEYQRMAGRARTAVEEEYDFRVLTCKLVGVIEGMA